MSPTNAGLRFREGGATMALQINRWDTSVQFWSSLVGYFLGETYQLDSPTLGGNIKRALPIAHPDMPWLFCDSLKSIQGVGKPVAGTGSTKLKAPSMDGCAIYPKYRIVADFQPRLHAVVPDDDIPNIRSHSNLGSCYAIDGTSQSYKYASEWLRFLDIDEQGVTEVIQAKHGQQTFLTSGGVSPNPSGKSFPGTVSMRLPKGIVTAKWYGVPYRYLTSPNSHIKRNTGKINQKWFMDYSPGSLLYQGYKVVRYAPAVPRWWLDKAKFVQLQDKVCDIEFMWERVERETPSAPSGADMPNGNFIAAGHNLLPWYGDRKFYYAVNKADAGDKNKWYPTYLSFPFELLFTDPDALVPNPY